MKRCTKCGRTKKLVEFYSERRALDGKRSQCKLCIGGDAKRWRDANRVVYTASKKRYRIANKNMVAARKNRWAIANKDAVAAHKKRWRAANPDKVKTYLHRRRALKVGAPGIYVVADIAALVVKQDGKCATPWCDADVSMSGPHRHLDHKTPLSRGGSNYSKNLQWMCAHCNDSKGMRTMEEWLKQEPKAA